MNCESKNSDECCEDDRVTQEIKEPKTNAQKCKEYRERLKITGENELKKKNAQKCKEYRERQKCNNSISTKTPAEYKREYRRKMKLKNQNTELNTFLAKDDSNAISSEPTTRTAKESHAHNAAVCPTHFLENDIYESRPAGCGMLPTAAAVIQSRTKPALLEKIDDTTVVPGNWSQHNRTHPFECKLEHVKQEYEVNTNEMERGHETSLCNVGFDCIKIEEHAMKEEVGDGGTAGGAVTSRGVASESPADIVSISVSIKREDGDSKDGDVTRDEAVHLPVFVEIPVVKTEDCKDPPVLNEIKVEKVEVEVEISHLGQHQGVSEEDGAIGGWLDAGEDHSPGVGQAASGSRSEGDGGEANKDRTMVAWDCREVNTQDCINTYSSEKPYSGELCNTSFESYYGLHNHLKTHSYEIPNQYTCEICMKSFSKKSNLQTHRRIHSGEKPYSCDVCKKSFNRSDSFHNHLRIHSSENPYSCELCKKTFCKKSNLLIHKKIHSGEKPYSCDVCKKSFNRNDNLLSHLSIHSGAKPYSCDLCNKSFSQKGYLQAHKKLHSEEKPYSCEICPKSFSILCHLKKHLRIHSGETPYSCDVCKKSFNHRSSLKNHSKTHSEEKPYSCHMCDKSFVRNGGLRRHLNIHLDVKPYSCDVCKKSFNHRSNLQVHLKTQHV